MTTELSDFLGNLKTNLQLKDKQVEVIQALLNGKNVLAALPTGYGKSLIFQLFPIIMNAVRMISF